MKTETVNTILAVTAIFSIIFSIYTAIQSAISSKKTQDRAETFQNTTQAQFEKNKEYQEKHFNLAQEQFNTNKEYQENHFNLIQEQFNNNKENFQIANYPYLYIQSSKIIKESSGKRTYRIYLANAGNMPASINKLILNFRSLYTDDDSQTNIQLHELIPPNIKPLELNFDITDLEAKSPAYIITGTIIYDNPVTKKEYFYQRSYHFEQNFNEELPIKQSTFSDKIPDDWKEYK